MQSLLSSLPLFDSAPSAAAAKYPGRASRFEMATPVRILILEPNELAVRDCVRGFTERGWQVTYCPTFLEALYLLEGPPFDLVLVEMTLPDIMGTEAWAFIQKIQPNAAGIITTASVSLHRAINAIGAGAHAYLLKPLEVSQLCDLVEHLLEQQRVRNQSSRIQKQMVALANLLATISRAATPEQILDRTLAHLRGILYFDLALIYVLNLQHGEWVYQRVPRSPQYVQELDPGQIELLAELSKQAVASRQAVAFASTGATLPVDKHRLEALGIESCAVIPLLGQQGAHGALVVVNKLGSAAQLESLDVQVLTALCQAVAIALDRAQVVQGLHSPEQLAGFTPRPAQADMVA